MESDEKRSREYYFGFYFGKIVKIFLFFFVLSVIFGLVKLR